MTKFRSLGMSNTLMRSAILSLFCHFRTIERIGVISALEKSGFDPSLTEEGYIENN